MRLSAALVTLLTAAAATTAVAATLPHHPRWWNDLCHPGPAVPPLPTDQEAVFVPENKTLNFVTVGRGVQNYTCSRGRFLSAGAKALLYDIGCLINEQNLVPPGELATCLPKLVLANLPFPQIGALPPIALEHYFVPTPGADHGISPFFVDPGTDQGVTFKAIGSLPDVDAWRRNVAWLELEAIAGDFDFGSIVLRTHTAGGVPNPRTCEEGDTTSVPYAALYWFYK